MPRAKKTTAVIEDTQLPVDLKEQLNALVPTEAEYETNETFLKLEDNLQNALAKAADEIKRIDERADFAINVVTQAIRTRATVEKGRVLLSVRESYHHLSGFDGTWTEWLAMQNLSPKTVGLWINAARVVEDASPIFGEELLLSHGVSALDGIHRLPTEEKLDVLEKAEATGKPVTEKEVRAVSQKTTTKISKAAELLAEARAKREERLSEYEEAKADPTQSSNDYKDLAIAASKAKARVDELEQQLTLLRNKAAREEERANSEAKQRQIAQAELDSLKFDDEAARGQRVKRIQSTLTIQIPQVMGDIQKYLAERTHYDPEYVEALDTLIKDLKSYVVEHSV